MYVCMHVCMYDHMCHVESRWHRCALTHTQHSLSLCGDRCPTAFAGVLGDVLGHARNHPYRGEHLVWQVQEATWQSDPLGVKSLLELQGSASVIPQDAASDLGSVWREAHSVADAVPETFEIDLDPAILKVRSHLAIHEPQRSLNS